MLYPEPIPKGFKIISGDQYTATIHYKRTGMEAMHIFMVVWLSFWTMGCFALVSIFFLQFQGIPVDNTEPIPFIVVLGFCTAEIIVASLLIYSLFAEKIYRLDYGDLTVRTKLFSWQWQQQIPKAAIAKVIQVQDGGRGRDSFPSWGLKLQGKPSIRLIFRQPYESSQWLGQVIASWAKVEYIPAPPRRKSLWS